MRVLSSNPNVDLSNLVDYPDGRIRNNDGSGNGTGVNENVYGDIHQTIAKLMRLYNITPNGLPDNETNGFQIVEALAALASKNDYIYPLATDGTFLSVNIKLSSMNTNEYLVCLAAADKGVETQIKGIGAGSFPVTYSGNFKANESVRLVRTSTGVSIIRLADWNSLSAMASDLLFLKKASQAQEDAGAVDTVATTPLVNKVTFTKRVIGLDSGSYLATALRNGLYPKEHFAIVAAIGADPIKNKGYISGVNVGTSSGALATGGNATSATATSTGPDTFIVVNLANAMVNTSYIVHFYIESLSGSIDNDNDIGAVVFKPISMTQFQLAVRETSPNTQSIKIHFKVEQL